MKRKVGKFIASRNIVNNLEYMTVLMQKCIIYRAEASFYQDSIEYLAYSEMFDEISEGEIIPSYQIIFDYDSSSDSVFVSAERH